MSSAEVHPSAVGQPPESDPRRPSNNPAIDSTKSTTNDPEANTSASGEPNPAENKEYPEQRHAGKVGYGPNYGQGVVSF
jgi:hypothetical protein